MNRGKTLERVVDVVAYAEVKCNNVPCGLLKQLAVRLPVPCIFYEINFCFVNRTTCSKL